MCDPINWWTRECCLKMKCGYDAHVCACNPHGRDKSGPYGGRRERGLYARKNQPYSAVVLTFLPAPLKPNFLMVVRNQGAVGPSSICLLVSTRNEALCGRTGRLFASRNDANSL